MSEDPKFMTGSFSRFDIDQRGLANCWWVHQPQEAVLSVYIEDSVEIRFGSCALLLDKSWFKIMNLHVHERKVTQWPPGNARFDFDDTSQFHNPVMHKDDYFWLFFYQNLPYSATYQTYSKFSRECYGDIHFLLWATHFNKIAKNLIIEQHLFEYKPVAQRQEMVIGTLALLWNFLMVAVK